VTKRKKNSTSIGLALSAAVILSMTAAAVAQTSTPPKKVRRLEPVTQSLPVIGGSWSAQGPGPILFGQVEGITNGPVAGAINSLVTHPTDANTIWVASVNGGVWKTTNATSGTPTWTPLTDGFSSLSMSVITLDPTDATSNTLIAGTGQYSSFGANGPLGSFLRTTNGGTSWTAFNPAALSGKSISGIAARGSTIIVATRDTCGNAVYRSTDGGTTFTGVSSVPSGTAYYLAGDPTNNAVLYASIQDCSAVSGGVYKSTDTGATWTRVSNSTMNTQLNQSNGSKIAVGLSGQVYVGIMYGTLQGLFRSANGGASWTALDLPSTTDGGFTNGLHPGGQGGLHFSIAADRSNTSLVYVGGDRQPDTTAGHGGFPNALGAYNYDGRLFRVDASRLSGTQATPLTHCTTATAACNNTVSTSNNSAPHADSRAMAFDASGNLIEVDDGGIFRRSTPTGLGDWTSLNGNLQITETHDVVYDHVSKMIMAGSQDNGTSEQTAVGGTTWSAVISGDGGDPAADDLTSISQSTRYGSAQTMLSFLRRAIDSSGVTTSWIYPRLTVTAGTNPPSWQFVTPTELNRVDARRALFASNDDLYESYDGGDTIAGLGFNHYAAAVAYGGRSAGVDNADVIWAIGNTGPSTPYVYVRTTAAGALTQTATAPPGFLLDIAVDPTDWHKAYIVNWLSQVYATSDTGATWQNVTGNLGSGTTDLRTVAFVPGSPNIVVVGGVGGVFRMATNNTGVWNQLGSGLPNAIVKDLDYDPLDDVLVAATAGRGVWKLASVAVSGTLPSLTISDGSATEGNSGNVNASFAVTLSPAVNYTVGVNYATSNGTATGDSRQVTNGSYIAIPDSGAATPYPSSISVSGVVDPIRKVTVTLHNFNHTYSSDVDVLLVGPTGQSVVLMGLTGANSHSSQLELTFDDSAAAQLPQSAYFSGTYRPSNYRVPNSFPSPAPGGPYGSALSSFIGTSANGTWSLYVVDQTGGDQGSFAQGWTLTFTSGDYAPASAPLVFQPGETSKVVNVSVFGDTTAEADETFFVTLSSPSNATISRAVAQGTIVNDDTPAAPSGVTATATAANNVNVSWTAAPFASSYAIFRKAAGGSYTQVGTASGSPYNDSTAAANSAYLYKVRALAGSVQSADSGFDLATTVIFTDPILTAGSTPVSAVHFTELLTAVNAVRALAGSSSVAFTIPAPGAGVNVLAAHISDLRNGLTPARSALGLSTVIYSNPVITAGSSYIQAVDVTQLRTGVQ
jgi:subtilisin-like proprotein convertase family protein